MPPVDSSHLSVPALAHPHAPEPSFADLMADQLRRTPWFAASIGLHALILVLLVMLLPDPKPDAAPRMISVLPHEQPIVEPPPPDDPEPIVTEPVLDDTIPLDTPTDVPTDDPVEAPSPFDSTDVAQASDIPLGSVPGLGGGPPVGPYGRGTRGGKRGGGGRLNPALDAALGWLARHQDDSGRWDADGFMKHDSPAHPLCDGPGSSMQDVGVTGLAALAFLGDGNTLRSGPYKDQLKRAVRWLLDQQDSRGLIGSSASHDFIYGHAIATYALVEAAGLSEYRLIRPAVQKALDYLESHRNPYMVWRYQPRDNDNDTSVTGWGIMAYVSARNFGFEVNDRALDTCAVWLDQVTDSSTGRHGYSKRGELSSRHPGDHASRFPPERGECMTAVGLFCRAFLGQDPREQPVMARAAELISAKPPQWDAARGTVDHYYWYYGSYALYQMGGQLWREWSAALNDSVIDTQRTDGNFKGSWDPAGAWGEDGGRVYSTAILALTLQAYFRYTPLIR